jgi:uncharacterized protein (TIGR02569 family)
MTGFPSQAVLEAFGTDEEPVSLVGGEGMTFRAGAIVVKRVHDAAEAEWVQDLLERIEEDGFRVAAPVRTVAGPWLHDGWSASEYVTGLRPAAPRWDDIANWGLRFGDAAQTSRPTHTDALQRRGHRWAVADRVAWDEAEVELTSTAAQVYHALRRLLSPAPAHGDYFVHGDLSGNVFLDRSGVPVILDVSPYLRERRWAAAIVTVDAVLWHGAELSIAQRFVDGPEDLDLLARAFIFRLVAEQLATTPRHRGAIEPFRRAQRALAMPPA